MNGSSKVIRASSAVRSPQTRVSQHDWETLSGELSRYGCAVLEELLSPDQCRQIAALLTTRGKGDFSPTLATGHALSRSKNGAKMREPKMTMPLSH
jgi:hypothetical protein